jgi:hypothetical protein
MFRGADPVLGDPLELLGGVSGVGGHHQFQERMFAAGKERFEVALDRGLERLFLFPLRMLRRERLHPVDGKKELEIGRLLAPQRSVVIEDGNPLSRHHELLAAFLSNLFDELDDGLLRRGIVP